MTSTWCPSVQSPVPFMWWSAWTNTWAVGLPLRKDVSCMRLTKYGERWALPAFPNLRFIKMRQIKMNGVNISTISLIYTSACLLSSLFSPSLLSFLPPPLCFPLSSSIHSFLKRMHWVKIVTFKLKKGKGGYIFRVNGFKVNIWIQYIYKSLVESPLGFSLIFFFSVWLDWKKNYPVIHMDYLKLNKQYK